MTGRDDARDDRAPDDRARAREDAEWREIVENYGERPAFPDIERPRVSREPEPDEDPAELAPSYDEDERYVPPPPPPVPRPEGLRLVAWIGLFGVPAVVLFCIVLGISLPSILGVAFVLWFVGGFGYLVATMKGPRDPDGGWDDGAVI